MRTYKQVFPTAGPLSFTLVCTAVCLFTPELRAQQLQEQTAKPAMSVPLSTLAYQKESNPPPRHDAHPVRPLPRPSATERKPVLDKAIQKPKVPLPKLDVSIAPPFDGVGGALDYTSPVDPSDTVGAVGRTQYVQWVNQAIGVFDKKTGKLIGQVANGSSLWSKLGGICAIYNDGDPVVLYDREADRWVLSQFAVSGGESNNPMKPYAQCVAVSTSPDATGTYSLYQFNFENFNDYGKLGNWPDAYYASFNMFLHTLPDPNDTNYKFLGARICALEKAKMLVGADARMKCFDVADQGGLLPTDLDGRTMPASGSPNYVLGLSMASSQLSLWKFHVDWTDPNKSTLTGPVPIPVSDFNISQDNVQQPKTSVLLQTLGDRLMFRLAYRNFGDHEALVATHAVAAGASAGIRWYEIRNPGSAPLVTQQGTFAPDPVFRWMSSAAMDKMGNIMIGYSVSSSKIFPSIRLTGRDASDAPGTLRMEETTTAGERQQPNSIRWGDYSSVSVDPDDDCTLYFTTEYLQKQKQNWSTKVVRVRFNSCQ
jgi:hypothetical protein